MSRCDGVCASGKQCTRNPARVGATKCWQHGGLQQALWVQVVQPKASVRNVSWRESSPTDLIKLDQCDQLRQLFNSQPNLASNVNNHGETPLVVALRMGRQRSAWVCLQWMNERLSFQRKREILTLRDTAGRQSTALHHAARKGMFALVCELVRMGAEPKSEDGFGHYPETLAINHKHKSTAGFLQGRWYRKPWSRELHQFCPFPFQREVWYCLRTTIFAQQYHDVRFLIFNELLKLHKQEYSRVVWTTSRKVWETTD